MSTDTTAQPQPTDEVTTTDVLLHMIHRGDADADWTVIMNALRGREDIARARALRTLRPGTRVLPGLRGDAGAGDEGTVESAGRSRVAVHLPTWHDGRGATVRIPAAYLERIL